MGADVKSSALYGGNYGGGRVFNLFLIRDIDYIWFVYIGLHWVCTYIFSFSENANIEHRYPVFYYNTAPKQNNFFIPLCIFTEIFVF